MASLNPSSTGGASSLLDSFSQKLDTIRPTGVLVQMGAMAGGAIGAFALFACLRPLNPYIFQPRVKYSESEKRPPPIGSGIFGWVQPMFRVSEAELMRSIGLDAVAYLRFLRMCIHIFICLTALGFASLVPSNYVYNLKHKVDRQQGDVSFFSNMTLQDVRGPWLWLHTSLAYIFTFVIFFFIWRNYAKFSALKRAWFLSNEYQLSLATRTVLITDIPKSYRTDKTITFHLSHLDLPARPVAVHVGHSAGQLPKLIAEHDNAVRDLESTITTYTKRPDKLPEERPTVRIGHPRNEKLNKLSKWTNNLPKTPLPRIPIQAPAWAGLLARHVRKLLSWGGKRVDAIDHLTEKIKALEQQISSERMRVEERKCESYAFAIFKCSADAHAVAKALERQPKDTKCHFQLAPTSQDIIWENIKLGRVGRAAHRLSATILFLGFCFLAMFPVFLVSLLSNIVSLSAFVPFIRTWSINYKPLMEAFVGVIPPMISVLFQAAVPSVLRKIAARQGNFSKTQSDRAVTARYDAFLLFNQFFIFSVTGVFVSIAALVVVQIKGIRADGQKAQSIGDIITSLPDQVYSTFVRQSSYWLTILPLRGFTAMLDLSKAKSLAGIWTKDRLVGRTPREIRDARRPLDFEYDVYYPNHLLLFTVAIVYAPISPMVTLFSFVVFCVSWIVFKFQLLYAFVTREETGGREWRVVINRVLFSTIIMQIILFLTIGLKIGWPQAVAIIPMILSVFVFKFVLSRRFDQRIHWFIPNREELAEVNLHEGEATIYQLEARFHHPSMDVNVLRPMLHRSVEPLLPTIYHESELSLEDESKKEKTPGELDGWRARDPHFVLTKDAGGLRFDLVTEQALVYQRSTWLQRRLQDSLTMNPATALQAGKRYLSNPAEAFKRGRSFIRSRSSQLLSTRPSATRLSSSPASFSSVTTLVGSSIPFTGDRRGSDQTISAMVDDSIPTRRLFRSERMPFTSEPSTISSLSSFSNISTTLSDPSSIQSTARPSVSPLRNPFPSSTTIISDIPQAVSWGSIPTLLDSPIGSQQQLQEEPGQFSLNPLPPSQSLDTSVMNAIANDDVRVHVRMEVETIYGETVYIVGSSPELGSWQFDSAVPLDASEYSEKAPLWQTILELPRLASFEYKLFIRRADGSIQWEGGKNRSVDTSDKPSLNISGVWTSQ